jgi:ABC-type amino acid transport substrate-binding protein
MHFAKKKSRAAVIALMMGMMLALSACGQSAAKKVAINSSDDLAGKRVGVQVSTTAHDSCNEFLKKMQFDLTTYDQVIQPFADLKAGRLDAVVVDEVVAKYYVSKEPKNFKVTGARLTNEPIGICLKKTNGDMRDKFEQVIAELKKDGKLKEISEKWFGEDLTADVEGSPTDTTPRGSIPSDMKVLKVGVDDSYPPMEFKDEKNELVGFDVDLAKAIGEKLGLQVEFVSTAWDGIFTSLNTDKFDAIISSISVNEERQKNFALTKPYIANAQVIVVSAD